MNTCWLKKMAATALGLWLTGFLPGAMPVAAADEPHVEVSPAKKIVLPPGFDRRKREIEGPTERLIAQLQAHEQQKAAAAAAAAAASTENPKVEPGKVRWHASFDDACKAAQRSGKPVLLFQLLGQLDQRFT
jgi:hypothetical protein